MAYTTIDNPELYFQTKLWTGTGSSNALTLDGDEDMQPDFVWIKCRSVGEAHRLYDPVRGATKQLVTSDTSAESTDATGLTAFDSDGFTVSTGNPVNASARTYVAWCWKAGTAFSNDASATSVGSIDSDGSINQDAGFSICSYTGTGSAGTIKHGLNSTPSIIILKNRIGGSLFWYMYHKSLGNNTELYLNATDAAPASTSAWNTTSPTSSVFSVGSHAGTNGSSEGTIAYCFLDVQGYSKFGSYTGNGSTTSGIFIHTGFKPAFYMSKRTDSTDDWNLHDNKRPAYNPANIFLEPNTQDTEGTRTIDFLSNGIKHYTSNAGYNASGATYIYMAFAEAPFVNSNGVPNNAR
jgi:hypothetical protein